MAGRFDRAAEDVGNIVALDHVNLLVDGQRTATMCYLVAMGFTRDPYLMPGVDLMWVNLGRSQFHLPNGEPQILRGRIGIVVPDCAALLARLERVRPRLACTRFVWREYTGHVDVTCPWGNTFRCHAPDAQYGPMALGMPYVEFDVPAGTADGIARFYRDIIGAPATVAAGCSGRVATVASGIGQSLRFRETKAPLPAYDGHHVQVYAADFSGPHRRLLERGLVTEESDRHQYRFVSLAGPADGRALYEAEHEVRSMRHPLYARPLANRDTTQSNMAYRQGHDALPV
ncbi:MAG: hypothetical protein EXQ97_01815 [Alphaproteobacteria bacterium]|nr:hypothetical protein [Alphaproteobacteria bacterium]